MKQTLDILKGLAIIASLPVFIPCVVVGWILSIGMLGMLVGMSPIGIQMIDSAKRAWDKTMKEMEEKENEDA